MFRDSSKKLRTRLKNSIVGSIFHQIKTDLCTYKYFHQLSAEKQKFIEYYSEIDL